MSFENDIKKLEQMVLSLESGELSLDKAVEMYGEGMKLSLKCREELENAKLKITSGGGKDEKDIQ